MKLCSCLYSYTDVNVINSAIFALSWTKVTNTLYAYNNCDDCHGAGVIASEKYHQTKEVMNNCENVHRKI